jgi:DNA polymerase-3 subunit beta
MKAECVKDTIKNGIQQAERMTGKNLSLPVLSGIFLSAQGNTLVLRATNLDLGIEIRIPAKIDGEGSAVVPGNILSGILSALYDVKITLEIANENLILSSVNAKSTVKCLPSDDFPTLPTLSEAQSFTVPAKKFIDGVKGVWYSASVSDMKQEIASVYIYPENEDMVFAATDSFRLAEKRISIKKNTRFSPILVPYKNMIEILRVFENFDGDVDINFNKNQMSVSSGNIYVTSRIIDGVFPDYRQIIPKEYVTEATMLKQDIINALKMTNLFSDKFNRVDIRVNPENKLFEVEARNSILGENTTKIDATLSGKEISCGFNQKYILDCFQAIKHESVIFRFSGVGRPLVIQGVGDGSFVYLVMPLTA